MTIPMELALGTNICQSGARAIIRDLTHLSTYLAVQSLEKLLHIYILPVHAPDIQACFQCSEYRAYGCCCCKSRRWPTRLHCISALLVHAEMDGDDVKNACTGTRWKLSSLQQAHHLFVTVWSAAIASANSSPVCLVVPKTWMGCCLPNWCFPLLPQANAVGKLILLL